MSENVKRGLFLTVEGVEGVGKSTNMAFIENYLKSKGIELISTREPGGTPFAESIRELLLTPSDETVNETAELLLVFAARAQHLHTKILPALERGVWVLSDRFTDATYAYQGGGRRLPMGAIAKLEHLVQRGVQPDLTLFLDLDVETGMSRVAQRGERDRFEQEELEFFENVRAAYWDRVHQHPERYSVIDAAPELPAVQSQIETVLDELLETYASDQ